MLVRAKEVNVDSEDGCSTLEVIEGTHENVRSNLRTQGRLRYCEAHHKAVLSLLEHDGPAYVWARSEGDALNIVKIDLPILPDDKLARRAKFVEGFATGDIIEDDFFVTENDEVEHCHGAAQPIEPIDFASLPLQFPHWPPSSDKASKCFRVHAKVLENSTVVQVLSVTSSGTTDELPTDNILRTSAEILARGVPGAKGRRRVCGVVRAGSTLRIETDAHLLLTLSIPKAIEGKVNLLVYKCADIDFILSSSAVPIVSLHISVFENWTHFGMHATGKVTSVAESQGSPLAPADDLRAWESEARRDWPQSKGRTFVLESYGQSDRLFALEVPRPLAKRFASLPFDTDDSEAKIRIALDRFDNELVAHYRLVNIIDHVHEGSERVKSLAPKYVQFLSAGTLENTTEPVVAHGVFKNWAGSRLSLGDHKVALDLSPVAKHQLEELVATAKIEVGTPLKMKVRLVGHVSRKPGKVLLAPLVPQLRVEALSLVAPDARATATPSMLLALRDGKSARGRVYEAELSSGLGAMERDGTIRLVDCAAVWVQALASAERVDQRPQIDALEGQPCVKVKFLVESVQDEAPFFRVRLLSVASSPLGTTLTLGAPDVPVQAPWFALANGAWGQTGHVPVWIPATDSASRTWLARAQQGMGGTVSVRTTNLKKHAAGFMYFESQFLGDAPPP